jgi:ubiquinone/menaquinone biosynthesis C-methylase UbiE
MKTYQQAINEHYSRKNLGDAIREALVESGEHVSSHADTAAFDEFHIRGREATRALADMAGLTPGSSVLDLGCGIGGPARTLAAEFGCEVTGIDLVEEYVRAAEMLTAQVGLSDRVRFRHGDMTALPFASSSFDAALTIHTTMNIEDKTKLFSGIFRVLKDDGILALYEVMAGDAGAPHYPVPWASDSTIDFLVAEADMRRRLEASGFAAIVWEDVSSVSLDWLKSAIAVKKTAGQRTGASKVGLGVVMGATAARKSGNMLRNLEEGRISIVQAVLKKGA